jgi:lysophospholipase L1-like esterase
MRRVPLLAAILLSFAATGVANAAWIGTWGASPTAPSPARGPFPASPSFENQTIRQVVRISAGGQRVRVVLTNAYGAKSLAIGAVHVALAGQDGAIQPGTDHVVTFNGGSSAVIPAGAPLVSDPIDLPAPALTSLAVSIYFPEPTGPCTCHGAGVQTGYVAPADVTGATAMPADAANIQFRAFLQGVEVDAARGAKAVVTFGDSITDGLGSTTDANRRWPDILAERLAARGGAPVGVVNEGISGNRLLHNGAGDSALTRFDRDVLAVSGVAYVVVFEAINDIGLSNPPPEAARFFGSGDPVTADELIGAYKQIVARAHAHGLKVYGATVTPFEGVSTYSPEAEAMRQAVNAWIRTSGAFDAVIDFDAAWRDPTHPSQIRDGLHAGDHLHGSDAGYKVLADSIDLGLFKAKH